MIVNLIFRYFIILNVFCNFCILISNVIYMVDRWYFRTSGGFFIFINSPPLQPFIIPFSYQGGEEGSYLPFLDSLSMNNEPRSTTLRGGGR